MAFMAACSSFATFHVHTHGSNPALASFHGSQLNWKGRRNPSSCKLRVGFAAKAMGSDSNDSARQTKFVYDPMEPTEKCRQLDTSPSPHSLSLFSPSKINVFLRITNKRPDGFHDLASLFHVVEDIPPPISLDTPMVLMKPQQECSTAEVYKHFQLDKASTIDPLRLLEEISTNGISQHVCINDLEPPAFEVLPSLKKLKQQVLGANRGQYDAVFMSGSGSTIVGVGDPEPPKFIYDDDEYSDIFISDAYFLTRKDNEWYQVPDSVGITSDREGNITKAVQGAFR